MPNGQARRSRLCSRFSCRRSASARETAEGGLRAARRFAGAAAGVCAQLGIRRVFEFGTGRSTRAFLDAECEVASVEDSAEWARAKHNEVSAGCLAPRSHSFSFLCVLSGIAARQCGAGSAGSGPRRLAGCRAGPGRFTRATPFREHALAMAFAHARGALIVVDDAGISHRRPILPTPRGTQRRSVLPGGDRSRDFLRGARGGALRWTMRDRSSNAEGVAALLSSPLRRMKILISSTFFIRVSAASKRSAAFCA